MKKISTSRKRNLHDSWLQDFKISRDLKTEENMNSSIELSFLLANWESVLILNYYYAFFEKIPFEIFNNQYSQNDLLVHELKMESANKKVSAYYLL